MNKKKILCFLKLPPPVSGATKMNSLVNDSQLLRMNFDVSVIAAQYSEDSKSLGKPRFGKIIKFILFFFRLTRELIINRPDVVYFQLSPLGLAFIRDFIFIFLIKFFQIKILFHLHGKGIKKKAASNRFLKLVYTFAFHNEYLICLSELLKEDIDSVYSGTPFILPNAIKPLHFTVMPKNDQLPQILFLSNLFISKGIFIFLDALSILNKERINFRSIIVGAEGDVSIEDLYKKIDLYGLGDVVEYIGAKYESEKLAILNSSDVLVFPTLEDVWGLVILEAMYCGIPVIASHEGAIPEIIDDGKTGFLVPKNDSTAIATKIEALLTDSTLRIAMGEESQRKFHLHYTDAVFENNLVKIFNSIFDRKLVEK
jgi:glycosyltransferase involved in cell wall biosynthesis